MPSEEVCAARKVSVCVVNESVYRKRRTQRREDSQVKSSTQTPGADWSVLGAVAGHGEDETGTPQHAPSRDPRTKTQGQVSYSGFRPIRSNNRNRATLQDSA